MCIMSVDFAEYMRKHPRKSQLRKRWWTASNRRGHRGPAGPHEAAVERCSRCHAAARGRPALLPELRAAPRCAAHRLHGVLGLRHSRPRRPARGAPRSGARLRVPSRTAERRLGRRRARARGGCGDRDRAGGGSGEALAGITRSLLASGGAGLPAAHPSRQAPRQRRARGRRAVEAPAEPRALQSASPLQAAGGPRRRRNPGAGGNSADRQRRRRKHTSTCIVTHEWQRARKQAGSEAADHARVADHARAGRPSRRPRRTRPSIRTSRRALVPQGTLLTHYALVAHSALANDIALLSGQAPNAATEAGCPTYSAVQPPTVSGAEGLASGSGCVYPSAVQTLAERARHGWTQLARLRAGHGRRAPRARRRRAYTLRSGKRRRPRRLSTGADYVLTRDPVRVLRLAPRIGGVRQQRRRLQPVRARTRESRERARLQLDHPRRLRRRRIGTLCAVRAAPPGSAPSDAFVQSASNRSWRRANTSSHGLIVITFDSAPAGARKSPPGTRRSARFCFRRSSTTAPASSRRLTTYSLLKSLERDFGVPPSGHAADPGSGRIRREGLHRAVLPTEAINPNTDEKRRSLCTQL